MCLFMVVCSVFEFVVEDGVCFLSELKLFGGVFFGWGVVGDFVGMRFERDESKRGFNFFFRRVFEFGVEVKGFVEVVDVVREIGMVFVGGVVCVVVVWMFLVGVVFAFYFRFAFRGFVREVRAFFYFVLYFLMFVELEYLCF